MIFIVCWNQERLALISLQLGSKVFESETADGAKACKRIKELKPDFVILDLGTRPSHSLATAGGLGKTDSKIIIVDGTSENIDKAINIFPNAVFTTIESLSSSF